MKKCGKQGEGERIGLLGAGSGMRGSIVMCMFRGRGFEVGQGQLRRLPGRPKQKPRFIPRALCTLSCWAHMGR